MLRRINAMESGKSDLCANCAGDQKYQEYKNEIGGPKTADLLVGVLISSGHPYSLWCSPFPYDGNVLAGRRDPVSDSLEDWVKKNRAQLQTRH